MEGSKKCGILIKQINDELRKTSNNAMRVQNMTMAQLGALMELNCAPGQQLFLKELEQKLHVAQSTAAGIIVRLEQKGFVESLGNAADRRVKLVRITQAGIQCINIAEQEMMRSEDRLLSGLTETEREIFYTLLQKVCHSLM